MYVQNEATEPNNIYPEETMNLVIEQSSLTPEQIIKLVRPYIATMGISGAAGLATGAALKVKFFPYNLINI